MSDDLLLSLLWALPMAGGLAVLAIPNRAEKAIKVSALVVTALTFVLSLVAFRAYVSPGESSKAPASIALRERAEKNSLKPQEADASILEPRDEPGDLVVRHEWVGPFRIEYYLGLDGINLALILLTGLVGLLACLASWGIDVKVKGYFSL